MNNSFPPVPKSLSRQLKTLCGALALLIVPSAFAGASVVFNHVFAPQEGLVAPVEKPYRSEICLNGSWRFQPIALPADYKKNVGPAPVLTAPTADGWENTPIRIPSPWNVNAFPDTKGLGGDFRCFPSYPDSWNDVQMGWLDRKFTVPSSWKGRRIFIHFNAVAGDASVLVNNQPVGEHFDTFLPFDVDVTNSIQYGAENDLLVGVRKATLFDVQGKYGRRTYQGGSMWGESIVGIWQDVSLEAVPTVHVTDVFVKPLVDQDTLEEDVTIRNDTDHDAAVHVGSSVQPWISEAGTDIISAPAPAWTLGAKVLTVDSVASTVPANSSATVVLTTKVNSRLKFWATETPNLYGSVCTVSSDSGGVMDQKYTRFGWRQLTFQGSHVLLNGNLLIMKGDAWHFIGIPEMTRRYAWAWFKALKAAHGNAVRLHAEPYPTFFLDVADELGILVLDEDAIWASDGGPKVDDQAFWDNTEPHLTNLILRDRNHPSVFGWSISNELMAVVNGVFHAPQEFQDKVIDYDGKWADICRKNDPTRLWISADGEDDGRGVLPTYVVHYGGIDAINRAAASGKPWGEGEAGPAYYGSPAQIADQSGDQRAYLSMEDRMEGVAAVSYQSLIDQRKGGASYRSVFNLVWYGLKPLNLGMTDTSQPPTLKDGVFFPPFVEGAFGVQPERLGPYCTTLNPGYDPSLPLYEPWPLFTAISDAQADPPIPFVPEHSFTISLPSSTVPVAGGIKTVQVLAGPGGTLTQELSDLGVTVSPTGSPVDSGLLFIDGIHPPGPEAKPAIQQTLAAGGSVFVWGVTGTSLGSVNALLPYPVAVTPRTASSLVVDGNCSITAGLLPASLYFCELNPSTILPAGLGGPLIDKSTPLLSACNTDWMLWNRQPELTKTGMVLRSERQSKPSGVALAQYTSGKGTWILCNLPSDPQTSLATALDRNILTNLGVALGAGVAQSNILDSTGDVTKLLANGEMSAASLDEALANSPIPGNSGAEVVAGAVDNNRPWLIVTADQSGALNLKRLNTVNAPQSVVYLSFWLFSPQSLDNLLLDPHLPNIGLAVSKATGAQVWLSGKSIVTNLQDGVVTAPTLLLQQGWNHILIKVVHAPLPAGTGLSVKILSSQPEYVGQLRGTLEKP